MLHIAKGREVLTYSWPLAALRAGTTWVSQIEVWDADGVSLPLANYVFSAQIAEEESAHVIAVGTVSVPADGLIRWAFDHNALNTVETDVYRFTLDAAVNGTTQRLIDSRLPVRGARFAPKPEATAIVPPSPDHFPDAGNTGPFGTLTNMVGNMIVNVPGTVVENIRLTGGFIDVIASDVMIRNCEITSSDAAGIDAEGVDDLVVENVRIIGSGGANGIVVGNDATVRNCDISGFTVGVRLGGADISVIGNYIHALTAPAVGVESDWCSGGLIQTNTIDNAGGSNVNLRTDVGPIAGVRVLSNQFRGVPGYNVVVDIGAGASVVSDVEIAYNVGQRGAYAIAEVDPAAAEAVNIHDNTLT